MRERRSIAKSSLWAVVLFFGGALAAWAQSASPKLTATAVHVFTPTMPSGETPGNCWTTYDRVPRAYRCMVGNHIYDPCFATGKPNIVVCGADPTKNSPGFALSTGTLPATHKWNGSPWLVQLADGTPCRGINGARSVYDELVEDYDCYPAKAQPEGTYVYLARKGLDGNDFDDLSELWYALRITVRDGKLLSSQRVPVAAVWK
jgi:hypothetical protein